jgi:2,4-dienoyl-CoA reductase-like NADH-dependent reductase (Old Yellow Enzyme family)
VTNRRHSIVFSPGRIGTLELQNRLVRSGTFENAATAQGEVTDTLRAIYRTLAAGGVGLIVTGIMPVFARVASPGQVRIHDDACIPGLATVPRAVHGVAPDCKIIAQLWHPGRQVPDTENPARFASYLPPALLKVLQRELGSGQSHAVPHPAVEATAPSAILDATFDTTPRALGTDEVEDIIDAFANAVRRAQEAGFDGVQLHAAHGWLLSSFLSPHTNYRTDGFGGSTRNRTRIVTDILSRACATVGKDFPILIKMNTTDFLPDGTDNEEAGRIGELLSAAGFAALEASGGMWEAVTRSRDELGWPPYLLPEARVNIKRREDEAYFLTGARILKRRTQTPVILVGGLRSVERIEEILEEGAADFVALSRPLIREPDLPNRWLAGTGPGKAECLSCSACIPMGAAPLRCNSKAGAGKS